MIDNVLNMNEQEAREYIAQYLITLKLTEKQYQNIEEELAKWNSRVELANSKGVPDLKAEAEKEVERLKAKKNALKTEIDELKGSIESMQRQVPTLSARERTVDPDLLEQELIIASGYMPGEEEKAQADRKFKEIEKTVSLDNDLAELKAKMQKL